MRARRGMTEATAASVPIGRWWLTLGMAGLSLVLLGRLGVYPLFDVDEGAFAEASREMLSSGDWGHTTLNGADRFDKPILVYWLQASFMYLLGVNEWAVRLPSALCATASLAALVWHAHRLWPEASQRGWIAAWLLGSSAGFLLIGRAATADALLNALLLLGGLRLAAFATKGQLRDLRWAAAWLGLGALTKGPVALLIPGVTLLLWSLASDRGRRLRQALCDLQSWALLLGICLPWYVYAWQRHGDAFIDGFFLRHNLDRFGGPMEGHGGSLLYYAVVLPLIWLPWSALLLAIVWRARRWWADSTDRFFLIWTAFVLVFFSLSGTKLPHYVLYAGMPIALLAARALTEQALGPWQQRGLVAGLLGTPILLGGVTWQAPNLAGWVSNGHVRQLLATAPETHTVLVWCALTLVLILIGLKGSPSMGQLRWILPSGVTAALLAWVITPWWAETLQGPVKAAGLWARSQGLQSGTQWGLHQPSVGFYRQDSTPRQAPLVGEWALVYASRPIARPVDVVFESRGMRWVSPTAAAQRAVP